MNPNEHWMNNAMKDLEPEKAQAVGCVTVVAYVVMLFIGLLLCALLGSCSSHKNLTTEHKEQDSVMVDVRYQTIIVPDTVLVEIPAQTAERTTTDSTSHLENDYATSDARINPDGTLFHLLATKPQKKPVEVDKKLSREIASFMWRSRAQRQVSRLSKWNGNSHGWRRHVSMAAICLLPCWLWLTGSRFGHS